MYGSMICEEDVEDYLKISVCGQKSSFKHEDTRNVKL